MNTTAVALKAPSQQGKSKLAAALRKAAASVWQALEQSGQRRAERELAHFAAQYRQHFPELGRYAPTKRAAAPTTL